MVKKHLKRLAMPKEWPLPRKGRKFISRPRPGPHKLREGMPISLILRNVLGHADSEKDVKSILKNKLVLVDGRRQKDPKFIVGLMDVLSMPDVEEYYRVLFDDMGQISFISIEETDSKIKPCKIVGKTYVPGGKVQVNLFDGKNIIVPKDEYSVGDTLLVDFQNNIRERIPFELGTQVYLVGGSNKGKICKLESAQEKKVIVSTEEGSFETRRDYVFVIGKGKPCIRMTAAKAKESKAEKKAKKN